MIRVLLLLIFIISPFSVNAGAFKKLIFAGVTEQTILRVVIPAFLEGKGINQAITIVKNVSKSVSGRKYLYGLFSAYLITDPNSIESQNIKNIIIGANFNDTSFNKQLSQEKNNYDTYVKEFTLISKSLLLDKKYQCVNRNLIYTKNADVIYRRINNPLKEWDYGSFKELQSREIVLDNLEHDHIPSIAAVLKYLQKRDLTIDLNRKNDIGFIINNNATTTEVKNTTHRAGRTWGPKNTPSRIENDSSNLAVATIKDLAYYLKTEKKLTQDMVTTFVNIFVRNEHLCLYEKI